MTQQDIGIILQLIENWVSQLSETRLNEQCRQSGSDFFSYMTQAGVSAGYLAKLITEATGYNPRQLWTVQDAEILRDAIFRYEASIAAAKDSGNAKKSVRHFWG
jgi:hypothetical protein